MPKYFIVLEMQPKAKARPRVARGHAFMPKDYMQWKGEAGKQMRNQMPRIREPLTGRISISIRFLTASGKMRCDLDNACGAVFDALQDAEIIANDRDIYKMQAEVAKNEILVAPSILISLVVV